MATSERSGKHHILTVLVENKFGVLSRVAGLFARRGFNIVSLAVSPTEDERFSRMTIVVDVESAPLEQITKQLNKLIPVIKIAELHPDEAVERELMLVTVKATAELRSQVTELVVDLRGQIVDVGHDALTIHGGRRAREARRHDATCCSRSGSSSSSAPAASPCPSWPGAPPSCVPSRTARLTLPLGAERASGELLASENDRGAGILRRSEGANEHACDHLLRRRRRSRPPRGTQGRGPRLRLAGPRARAQPEGLRRRRARRPARGFVVVGQGRGGRAPGAARPRTRARKPT